MAAYYNEHDANAVAWLRELIARGHIAPGIVDDRSIVDVVASDLAGFDQCHFFAGIGVWSYALRRAGWDDARPVWTGSCPCQPFSSSGKQEGFGDERHLWPHLFRLIRECRPDVCFGEQVASPLGLLWLDAVHVDLEGAGYAVGAVDTCAAGVGAPHIRQRLYWLADAVRPGFGGRRTGEARDESGTIERSAGLREARLLVDAECPRLEGHGRHGDDGNEPGRIATLAPRSARTSSDSCRLADASRDGAQQHARELPGDESEHGERASDRDHAPLAQRAVGNAGPTNGLWRDADWLYCTDGKWRPVEPGTFPLAHGAPARVGRLRGYGNAINAAQAAAFIEAYLDLSNP